MFLPTNKFDLKNRKWEQLDIILITGDAYVDHPSFGIALIGRYLEAFGYRVGIIAQPRLDQPQDFKVLGEPKLFWGISSGNLDSMISNYTASKKIRNDNKYAEHGKAFYGKGKRYKPDRALIKYAQKVKELFDNPFVVLGGIEASLRRFSHYDFYQNKLRHSVLIDTKANLLVYGMGEKAILQIANSLKKGDSTVNIPGTVEIIHKDKYIGRGVALPSIKEMNKNRKLIVDRFYQLQKNTINNKKLKMIEQDGAWVIKQNPSQNPLTERELDFIYSLPYMRRPHSKYKKIPAFDMIKNSITSHRGCFGGCAFCSIGLHQGKTIQSRSEKSINQEVDIIKSMDYFHGHITDIGGPSADMYKAFCSNNKAYECERISCLYPQKCGFLKLKVDEYLNLLKRINKKVKKISIGSGLRLDVSMGNPKYVKIIVENYLSGYLNIAPEHISKNVLGYMKKFHPGEFQSFLKILQKGKYKEKYLLRPYFIIGHPGETEQDINNLVRFLKKNKIKVESIQEFVPIPLTLSAAYYFARATEKKKKINIPTHGKNKIAKKKILR